jgi:hypothetical protein
LWLPDPSDGTVTILGGVELIFADDSGKDQTRDTYVIEAAVSFNESKLTLLDDYMRKVKKKYGIDDRYELHWHSSVYKPRKAAQQKWPTRRLERDEHHRLRRDFLKFLEIGEATVIIAAHEHGRGSLVAKVGECLTFVAERAQMHLQDVARERGERVLGLLIADEPGGKAETAELAATMHDLHRHGSTWIDRFDTLVMNSFLYASDLVPGLQLADFVAGAADRALNRGDEYWWSRLAPYVRHKRGAPTKVLGYGLKLWPSPRQLRIGETKIT